MKNWLSSESAEFINDSSKTTQNYCLALHLFAFFWFFVLLWYFLRDGPKNTFFVNTQPVTHPCLPSYYQNGFGTTPIQVERGLSDRCLEDIRHPTPKSTKLAGGFKYFLIILIVSEDDKYLADLTWWWQLKYFLFSSPFWGRWTHFGEHIFQLGWFNHQPEKFFVKSHLDVPGSWDQWWTDQWVISPSYEWNIFGVYDLLILTFDPDFDHGTSKQGPKKEV